MVKQRCPYCGERFWFWQRRAYREHLDGPMLAAGTKLIQTCNAVCLDQELSPAFPVVGFTSGGVELNTTLWEHYARATGEQPSQPSVLPFTISHETPEADTDENWLEILDPVLVPPDKRAAWRAAWDKHMGRS